MVQIVSLTTCVETLSMASDDAIMLTEQLLPCNWVKYLQLIRMPQRWKLSIDLIRPMECGECRYLRIMKLRDDWRTFYINGQLWTFNVDIDICLFSLLSIIGAVGLGRASTAIFTHHLLAYGFGDSDSPVISINYAILPLLAIAHCNKHDCLQKCVRN